MRVGVSQGYSRSRTHCRRRVCSDVFFSFPTHTLPVVSRHSSAAYSLKLCRRHFLRGATSCRLSVSHLDQTLRILCAAVFVLFFSPQENATDSQVRRWKKNYFVCITWLNNLWISGESESCPLNGHLDFCYHQTFSTLVKYQNTEDLGKFQSKISTTTSLQPSLVLLCPSSHTHAFFIVLPVASYDLLFLPRPHFCCLTPCYFYTTSPHSSSWSTFVFVEIWKNVGKSLAYNSANVLNCFGQNRKEHDENRHRGIPWRCTNG